MTTTVTMHILFLHLTAFVRAAAWRSTIIAKFGQDIGPSVVLESDHRLPAIDDIITIRTRVDDISSLID